MAFGLVLVGSVAQLGAAPQAEAAVGINKTINFQGRLLTGTGAVVPDGFYNMEFQIWQGGNGCLPNPGTCTSANASTNNAGTLIWTEDWVYGINTPDNRITVKNGYFSVALGSICAVTSTTCTANTGNAQTNTVVDFNQDTLWLSMNVGNTSTAANFAAASGDGYMIPFRRMASAVYALQAENANKLGGLTASQFIQTTPANSTVNVIAPTAASTVALTVKGTTGTSANVLEIFDSTGTPVRQAFFDSTGALNVAKTIQPTVTNTVDIGLTGTQFRTGYFGTSIITPTIDTNTATTLNIGATGSPVTSGIALNQNTSVVAGKNFSLASGTGTFSQTFTGTTANAASITASGLTTGKALSVTSSNNTAANTNWSGSIFSPTNAQGTTAVTGLISGVDIQYSQAPTVAGNNETALNIALVANAGTPTDNTVNSLINIANNDTATGNQIAVTNGINISSLGGNASIVNGITIAGGTSAVTHGLNFTGTLGGNLINSGTFTVAQSGALQSSSTIQGTVGTFTSGGATGSAVLGTSSTTTGSILFRGSGGAGTLLLQGPATPNPSNFTLSIPAIGASANLCTDNAVCTGYAPSSGGNYIAKNTNDTSSASFVGNLLGLTNSNAGAAGVLSLTNSGTNSALTVSSSGNPSSGQALILATNTNGTPSGSLLDLRVGSTSASVYNVNASGNTEQLGYTNSPFGGVGTFGNLLLRSEEFNVPAAWTLTNISAPADGATAPDGSVSAEALSGTGVSSALQTVTTTVATTYTFSVWLKQVSGAANTGLCVYSTAGTPSTCTATAVTPNTSNWQRFSVTQTITGSPTAVKVEIRPGNGSTAVVQAWGAQLIAYSTPQVYTRTNGAAVLANTGGALNGLYIQGVQPAASAGNGTSALSVAAINGAKGGNTTAGSGTVGGTGGSIVLQGGAGGDATGTSQNGIGGAVLISGGVSGTGGTNNFNGNVIIQNAGGFTGIRTLSPGNPLSLFSPVTGDITADALFAASSAGAKILMLQGAASQTGNLLEMQNSSGVALSAFVSTGDLLFGANANHNITVANPLTGNPGRDFFITGSDGVGTGQNGGNIYLDPGSAGDILGTGGAVIVRAGSDQFGTFQVRDAFGFQILSVNTSNHVTQFGVNSFVDGIVRFANQTNGNTVDISTSVTASPYTLNLPTALGSSGDCLKQTNGTGQLGFGACAAGSVTLQNAYTGSAGASPSILTTSANKAVTIQTSNTSGIAAGAELFGVHLNAASDVLGNSAFTVNSTGIGVNIASTTPTTTADLSFGNGANRTINVLQAASGAGNNLTMSAGQGASGQLGGNLVLKAGANGTGAGTPGSIIAQANGGDSLTFFQLQNNAGNTLLSADSINRRVGVGVSFANMAAVGAVTPSTSTTGGTLAAATYFYKVTAIDAMGGETTPSTEVSQVTTGATSTVTLSFAVVSGAVGYKIYRSTTTNTEVYLTATVGNSSTTVTYVDTGAVAIGTGGVPTSNTAYVSTNVSDNQGALVIGGRSTPTGQVYVSGRVPAAASSITLNSNLTGGISVSGRYAYVTTNAGMSIYDVTNPSAPALISNYTTVSSGPFIVIKNGNYVYLFSTGMEIVDVSNPGAPTRSAYLFQSFSPSDVAIQGRYLYATAAGFTVMDIGNPTAPQIVSTNGSIAGGVWGVDVAGNYAYVTTSTTPKLHIVDISNPAATFEVGSVTTGTNTIAVSVSGRYAYTLSSLAASPVQVIDVSNPTAPAVVGQATTGTAPNDILVRGRNLFVVNSTSATLQMYNLANPTVPVSLGTIASGSATKTVDVSGRYAYTVNTTSGSLRTYDLGGLYSEELEAGTVEAGSLTVKSSAQVLGSINATGALTVGGSANFVAGLAATGGTALQGAVGESTILSVANANGDQIVLASTVNLVSNASFESGENGIEAAGWSARGAATLTVDTSQFLYGLNSLKVATTIAANDGAQTSVPLVSGANYFVSFYARVATGTITDFSYGYRANATDSPCATGVTLNTTWTRFSCVVSGPANNELVQLWMRKTGTTAETFYIDGVQLEEGGAATAFRRGDLAVTGGTTTFRLESSNTGQVVNFGNEAVGAWGGVSINTTGSGFTFYTGPNQVAANGGVAELLGGTGGAAFNGGAAYIVGGAAGSGNQNGGDVVLWGGARTGTGTGGAVIAKPQAGGDITSFFKVQNAAGTDIFSVDSVNSISKFKSIANTLALGAELYATNNFTNTTGDWGTYTGWASAPSTQITHTTGNVTAITNTSVAITATTNYQVGFTLSGACGGSADTLTVALGGATVVAVDGRDCTGARTYVVTTSNTNKLSFTPSTNWGGTISAVSIKAFSGQNFPLIQNYNSAGSPYFEVRNATSFTNVFQGYQAGMLNTTGTGNTAFGTTALVGNTAGIENTAIGYRSLFGSAVGNNNVAVGNYVLQYNSQGSDNSALGRNSLQINTTGSFNSALGGAALYGNTSGANNTAVGFSAGFQNTTGSNNTFVGYNSGNTDVGGLYFQTAGLTNSTAIGYSAISQQSNSIVLGSVATATNVGIGTTAPTSLFSVSPLQYSTGTAGTGGASSTTVTGVGTTFTKAMAGGEIIWADGTKRTINSVTNGTTLVINSATTQVNTNNYRIHYFGFQVSATGTIATQQTLAHTTTETTAQATITVIDNTDANTAGVNSVTNGLSVASTVNVTGGGSSTGTKTVSAINVGAPTLTACSGGTNTCAWNGLKISGNTSAIPALNQTGVNITNGNITGGTAVGASINLGTVTTSGSSTGLKIVGSGTLPTGGTFEKLVDIQDSSGRNLLEVRDMSAANNNFGAAATTGAFISRNSYQGLEYNKFLATNTDAAAGTTNTVTRRGDSNEMSTSSVIVGTTTGCSYAPVTNGLGGQETITATSAAGTSDACAELASTATAGTIQKNYASNNLPVITMKVRPTAAPTANSNSRMFFGLADNAAASLAVPTNGIFFTNCTAVAPTCTSAKWIGMVVTAGTATTVTCNSAALENTSGNINFTSFNYLRIEVRANNDIHFFVDTDVSTGIVETECGTGVSAAGPGATALGPYLSVNVAATGTTLGATIDYMRIWQDDAAGDAVNPNNLQGQQSAANESSQTAQAAAALTKPYDATFAGDLTEAYPVDDPTAFAPGDVVSLDVSGGAKVRKSDKPYDNNLVGVVSTSSNLVLGSVDAKTVNVGVAGRVPVKVSTENGPIAPGDLLTASSTPGVAMRATKAGATLGQALDGFSGTGEGQILVRLNVSGHKATVDASDLQAGPVDQATIGNLKVTGDMVVDGNATFRGNVAVGSLAVGGDLALGGEGNARGAIKKSFKASKTVRTGDVVALDSERDAEVRPTVVAGDTAVVGVALTDAAPGSPVEVAIAGTVQARAEGAIKAGDLLVSDDSDGALRTELLPRPGSVVGKALGRPNAAGLVWLIITLL